MEWTGGFRATERDLEIVKWLGRVRLARAGQVAERFAMTETKAYARLRGLRGMGLVRHVRRGVPGPGVFLATGQGLRATGLDLAEATVSAASLHHDLTVVDVGTGLERQRLRVETERELRLAGRTLEVRITRAGVKAAHLPDLAIAGPDGGAPSRLSSPRRATNEPARSFTRTPSRPSTTRWCTSCPTWRRPNVSAASGARSSSTPGTSRSRSWARRWSKRALASKPVSRESRRKPKPGIKCGVGRWKSRRRRATSRRAFAKPNTHATWPMTGCAPRRLSFRCCGRS